MCVCVLARQVEPVSVAGRGQANKGTALAPNHLMFQNNEDEEQLLTL
eukprot:SAG31_NODE_3063_length_4730_cov_6.014900_1_plen_47_part_00